MSKIKNQKRLMHGLMVILGMVVLVNAVSVKAQAKAVRASTGTTKIKYSAINQNRAQSISVVLKPRATTQLASFINETVTPGNANYRKYLTPSAFGTSYGESTANVNQLKRYFQKHHLKTKVYSGNLIMRVNGKAKNVEAAFNVKLKEARVGNYGYQIANHAPRLPKTIKAKVLGTFGLSTNTYSNAKGQFTSRLSNERSKINTYQTAPQKFMDTYNAGALYDKNYLGSGQTIGIISFAGFKASDATSFWKAQGIPVKSNRIKTYQLGKTSSTGTDETTMDVEQAGAVAPKANINVYVSAASAVGMINSLATAISQNQVDTLSISWGQSENQVKQQVKAGLLPKSYNQVINILMQQAAAQGITTFASTGDFGAYDGINENRYAGLTVDTPANSPYVTAVGGTSLPRKYKIAGKSYTVESERAWSSDFLYPRFDADKSIDPAKNPTKWVGSYFVGGGGGFSAFNALPDYQKGVSGVGTFRASQIWESKKGYIRRLSKPKVVTGTHSGRNLPDLSANADPNTGYSTYHGGKWYITGGTSVVAPQMAGIAAVLNTAQGKRLGFWNPQIYRFASSNASPFTPLNSASDNNNLYYTGQPGKLYNQATGLGTVNFGKLNSAFSAQ